MMSLTERIKKICSDVYGDTVQFDAGDIPQHKVEAVIHLIESTYSKLEPTTRNQELSLDFYGLRDLSRDPYTSSELEEKYGISRTRVRSIINKTQRKLRRLKYKLPYFSREEAKKAVAMNKELKWQLRQITTRLEYELILESIDELDLSVRAYNALHRAGYIQISQVKKLSKEELLKIPHMGTKSADEILRVISYY